uniref:Uncharacterized protein n=1 Tax=Dromaius novaehollandiae TaxID=8790 RepID=A0A8C4KJ53_DRONO
MFSDAALFLGQESEAHRVLSFTTVMRNKKLDAFLMALIFYLSFYLEKIALEKTSKTPVSTIVFLEEKELDDVLAKLEAARIRLAKLYCNLILGEGMVEHHHMSLIQEEVSRLLRSDIFNPTLREKKDDDFYICFLSRNSCAKCPSINTVAQQRSPVLSTLLPLPKHSAQHLFQKQFYRWGKTPQPCMSKDLPDFSELFTTRVGIIGAHRSELNPIMLMPLGMMEEEEEEQGQKRSGSSIPSNDLSLSTLRSPQSRLSTQSSVV